MTHGDEGYRLDELDRRIVYALMRDGRTTATSIAEDANVSGATVRNRIERLEDHDVITGYRADVASRWPAANSGTSTCVTSRCPSERRWPTRRGRFPA